MNDLSKQKLYNILKKLEDIKELYYDIKIDDYKISSDSTFIVDRLELVVDAVSDTIERGK